MRQTTQPPADRLTHNKEPFLDGKHHHRAADEAQGTGTEPPLMSAYFPKPRLHCLSREHHTNGKCPVRRAFAK